MKITPVVLGLMLLAGCATPPPAATPAPCVTPASAMAAAATSAPAATPAPTATPTLFTATAEASIWNVDPDHSSAQFAVKHLGLSTVRGELGKVTGALLYDEKDVTRSKVAATVDVKAINTREEKRDAHLRSDAFFDVDHHPNLTFTSTKVEKGAKGKLKVSGDLTIRGTTKPVVLEVDFTGEQFTTDGDTHLAAMATTKINRQDYGVSWNTTVASDRLLVADEVNITIDMDFIKAKPAK